MARREFDTGEGHAAGVLAWSQDVRAALRRLDPLQRRVVQLIYFERRTEQQTADELEMSKPAVSHSLAAAMQALALVIFAQGREQHT